jgi:hypothetical protein
LGGIETFDLVLSYGYRVPWDSERFVSLWESAAGGQGVSNKWFLQLVYDACCRNGRYLDPVQPDIYCFGTQNTLNESLVEFFVLQLSSIGLNEQDYVGKTILHHAAKHNKL